MSYFPLALGAFMGFGEWLKAKRQEKGLSLRGLAELAGISHISVDKAERGGGMRDSTLELVVRALAGESATEDELAALLREARVVRAGLSPEPEPLPDEELLAERLMAYTGDDPILVGAASTARSIAEALARAKANGPVGGEGMPPIVARGRGPKKGIQKVDK